MNEINQGYTRVTEILKAFNDFENIPESVLINAAERGSKVHSLCEKLMRNPTEFQPFLIDLIDEDCKGYFESFLLWFQNSKFTPLHIEKRLYDHDLKITGQIDLIGFYDSCPDEIILIDFKTPQNASNSWALQTAAYKHLACVDLNIDIDRRACLQLRKNGSAPKFTEFFEHERDLDLFLSAYYLHKFFEG